MPESAADSTSGGGDLPPPSRPGRPTPRLAAAALRTVALIEAGKGLFALGLAGALLLLTPEAVRAVLGGLGERLGLNPGGLLAVLLHHLAEQASHAALRWLAVGTFTYALIRLVEAWGLWRQRTWAEWLGAISGTIYIPFEIHELTRSVNVFTVSLLLVNIAIVAFLLWSTRLSRRTTSPRKPAPPGPDIPAHTGQPAD